MMKALEEGIAEYEIDKCTLRKEVMLGSSKKIEIRDK